MLGNRGNYNPEEKGALLMEEDILKNVLLHKMKDTVVKVAIMGDANSPAFVSQYATDAK